MIFDDGEFFKGWGWYIDNSIIIRIEKLYFCYKYSLWSKQGTIDGRDIFGYSNFKEFNLETLKKDNDLKIRLEWAINMLKQKNGI